jgi:hypothetical protein
MNSGENRRGVQNGNAKLTPEAVRDIRKWHIPGRNQAERGNTAALALKYGVNRRTITRIVDGVEWGWLED